MEWRNNESKKVTRTVDKNRNFEVRKARRKVMKKGTERGYRAKQK
jgi:hypothetical protein